MTLNVKKKIKQTKFWMLYLQKISNKMQQQIKWKKKLELFKIMINQSIKKNKKISLFHCKSLKIKKMITPRLNYEQYLFTEMA